MTPAWRGGRSRWLAVALLIELPLLFSLLSSASLAEAGSGITSDAPDTTAAAAGVHWEVLWEQEETEAGLVQVVQMEVNGLSVNYLLCDDSLVGAQITDDGLRDHPLFTIFALLEATRHTSPPPEQVLVLGLGAGFVPNALRKARLKTDVVEWSKGVAKAAELHFGYAFDTGELGTTHLMDARSFIALPHIKTQAERYDLVLHDLFAGPQAPQMLTRELFERLKSTWLTDRGLLVVNFVSRALPPPNGMDATQAEAYELSRAVAATLRSVFEQVRCYRELPLEFRPADSSNILCFCSARPWQLHVPHDDDAPEMSPGWLSSRFQQWEVLPKDSQDAVLITEGTVHRFQAAGESVSAELHQVARRDFMPHVGFWQALQTRLEALRDARARRTAAKGEL